MTRPDRKREIENVRAQGAHAFELGHSRGSNPYKAYQTTNHSHWDNGWTEAQWAAERNAEDMARREQASRFDAIRDDINNGLHGKALLEILDILEEMQS